MLWRIGQYLRYRWQAVGRHGVHSPFVYALADHVLPHQSSKAGAQIEQLRKQLLHERSAIAIEDHGAGFAGDGRRQRQSQLGQVVLRCARNRRSGELLRRLCAHLKPERALELGTNLGFSTMYQCAGLAPGAQLITVEGSAALAERARRYIAQQGFENAEVWNSTFEEALQNPALGMVDYVLLDGHHTYAASVHYFELLLPKLRPGALFILDDIYWSPGMAQAWRQLCAHPAVSLSIDLYAMGLLFVHRPQAREHFVLHI